MAAAAPLTNPAAAPANTRRTIPFDLAPPPLLFAPFLLACFLPALALTLFLLPAPEATDFLADLRAPPLLPVDCAARVFPLVDLAVPLLAAEESLGLADFCAPPVLEVFDFLLAFAVGICVSSPYWVLSFSHIQNFDFIHF